jgi:acetyl-CoA carboxylase biotin carboxyl carrier protein
VNLSNDDVQDILSLLDSLPYSELTLETSRFTLQLRRSAEGGWTQETQVLSQPVLAGPVAPATAPAPPSAPPPPVPSGAPPAVPSGAPPAVPSGAPPSRGGPPAATAPVPRAASGAGPDARDIVAPLLGTFYRAPQPGAPPFVDIGGSVEADTVVAIIETMKLMNPVYAGTTGTVTEICLDDGQFAEQGAVLMRVSGRTG